MKKIVTICILDSNRFFALGLKLILLRHFEHVGQGVFFVGEENVARADLVFWASRDGMPRKLCGYTVQDPSSSPAFIVVRAEKKEKLSDKRCVCEQGALWQGASHQSMLSLVEKALRSRERLSRMATQCPSCSTLKLTLREHDVMSCLMREMAPKSLPRYLNLSPKTVSAHKRAVMRKLGFNRNEELYHWLRNGGLDQTKGSLP